jgi:hypothetical protein
MECFLRRLSIYTKAEIEPTEAMKKIIAKLLAKLLSTLALATQQIKQGRLSESVPAGMALTRAQCNAEKLGKKLLGENDIEAVLMRLDRLTHEEALATAAETLQVVHGLVGNMKVVMDGERI